MSTRTLLDATRGALKSPQRNSFVVGFASALVLFAAVYIWSYLGFIGGIHADSPNGQYSLSVTAPMSPTYGGSYSIQLIESETSAVIRDVTVTVPRSEQTAGLREGGGSIIWDPTNEFADITIQGKNSVRIWVP